MPYFNVFFPIAEGKKHNACAAYKAVSSYFTHFRINSNILTKQFFSLSFFKYTTPSQKSKSQPGWLWETFYHE